MSTSSLQNLVKILNIPDKKLGTLLTSFVEDVAEDRPQQMRKFQYYAARVLVSTQTRSTLRYIRSHTYRGDDGDYEDELEAEQEYVLCYCNCLSVQIATGESCAVPKKLCLCLSHPEDLFL